MLDHDSADLSNLEEAANEAARRIASAEPGSVIVVADEQMSPFFEVPAEEED